MVVGPSATDSSFLCHPCAVIGASVQQGAGHVTATVLSTAKMFESDIVHFFTVKAGKIVSLRDFYDTAAVVEASRS